MLFFPGTLVAMTVAPDAQLSVLSASINDLTAQVSQLAEQLEGDGAPEPAAALFEVERSLEMATRSLGRARQRLGT